MRAILALLAAVLLASCQSVEGPTVSVTGSAVVEAQPDIISFSVTSTYKGHTTEEARSVTSGMINHAVAVLKDDYGVLPEDVTTVYFSVSPSYSYADGSAVPDGQIAVQRVSVILRDMEKAGEAISALSELDGIEISSVVADKSDKSIEMRKARELAVHDAVDKASVYATASGFILGDLVSISSTDSMAPEYRAAKVYAMEASGSSGMEYYSGTIPVSDEVSAVFRLVE